MLFIFISKREGEKKNNSLLTKTINKVVSHFRRRLEARIQQHVCRSNRIHIHRRGIQHSCHNIHHNHRDSQRYRNNTEPRWNQWERDRWRRREDRKERFWQTFWELIEESSEVMLLTHFFDLLYPPRVKVFYSKIEKKVRKKQKSVDLDCLQKQLTLLTLPFFLWHFWGSLTHCKYYFYAKKVGN